MLFVVTKLLLLLSKLNKMADTVLFSSGVDTKHAFIWTENPQGHVSALQKDPKNPVNCESYTQKRILELWSFPLTNQKL